MTKREEIWARTGLQLYRAPSKRRGSQKKMNIDRRQTSGLAIILDPNDPTQIYITTYGGGFWHGAAAGSANPPEAILTPIPIAAPS
jgi:hypothetical protein